MAEVAEGGVNAVVRARKPVFDAGDGADARLRRDLADRATRRERSATWKSSLGPGDLACLMSVIESQLLPRMLREYRPADRAPLGARDNA